MAKGSQNDRKTDAKISVVSYFYIKGENAPYYLFYNHSGSTRFQARPPTQAAQV